MNKYNVLIKKLNLDPAVEYVPTLDYSDVLRSASGEPIPAYCFENEPSDKFREIARRDAKKWLEENDD